MTFTFEGMIIPLHMHDALALYLEYGVPPGDFLLAVLENNLKEAVGRADKQNLHNIPAFVAFLYNEAPTGAWGTPGNIRQWIARREPFRAALAKAEGREP
jgi:hypothetical protein